MTSREPHPTEPSWVWQNRVAEGQRIYWSSALPRGDISHEETQELLHLLTRVLATDGDFPVAPEVIDGIRTWLERNFCGE